MSAVSQVMQKIGAYECHDGKLNREDPDWLLIYSYFTALLKADELPLLGQIGPCIFAFTSSCCVHACVLSASSQMAF